MSEPLLSIVVPTRDRLLCASSVIFGFTASEDPRVELIVHDNSASRDLEAIVAQTGDRRIRYFHVAKPLNMHENFDAAIAHARGRYVCAIGDDDGMIVSTALDVLERASDGDADAVLTAVPGYTWPGTTHRVWGESAGELVGMEMEVARKDQWLDPEVALKDHFSAGLHHSLGRLPRVYQGFVSRRSLDALRARCGTCFPGPSPDIANAVALVPFVNRILVAAEPTVISGHSPRSGGGAGSAGTHHGRLEDQGHLPPKTIETWIDAVPRFWSGPTIYAQSALIACQAAGMRIPITGYARLYAACLVYEPRVYWPLVTAAMRHAPGRRFGLLAATAFHTIRLIIVRGLNFSRNYLKSKSRVHRGDSFPDIAAVMREGSRRFAPKERGHHDARSMS